MTRATVLQEVRQMRFEELYERRQRRPLTMAEAAEMLGVTERTFRRWSGQGPGGQDPPDPGAPGRTATGHHTDSGLVTGSARSVGAGLPHPARSVTQEVGAGRDHGHGGGQSVPDRAVPPPA
jgi:hypothetical protein